LIFSTAAITLALVFYSAGVWSERIARYLKPSHVRAFWTGFFFDVCGTLAMHRLAEADAGTPLVLHPWELDEGQPPLPEVPWGHAFVHKAGLGGYGSRLRRILRGLELVPLEVWVKDAEARHRYSGGLEPITP